MEHLADRHNLGTASGYKRKAPQGPVSVPKRQATQQIPHEATYQSKENIPPMPTQGFLNAQIPTAPMPSGQPIPSLLSLNAHQTNIPDTTMTPAPAVSSDNLPLGTILSIPSPSQTIDPNMPQKLISIPEQLLAQLLGNPIATEAPKTANPLPVEDQSLAEETADVCQQVQAHLQSASPAPSTPSFKGTPNVNIPILNFESPRGPVVNPDPLPLPPQLVPATTAPLEFMSPTTLIAPLSPLMTPVIPPTAASLQDAPTTAAQTGSRGAGTHDANTQTTVTRPKGKNRASQCSVVRTITTVITHPDGTVETTTETYHLRAPVQDTASQTGADDIPEYIPTTIEVLPAKKKRAPAPRKKKATKEPEEKGEKEKKEKEKDGADSKDDNKEKKDKKEVKKNEEKKDDNGKMSICKKDASKRKATKVQLFGMDSSTDADDSPITQGKAKEKSIS